MLYLTRKIGESIVINETIELTVVEVRGKAVKLGFTFPPEATVLRREIFDRVQAEGEAEEKEGVAPSAGGAASIEGRGV
jgi:carbon storage regulator